MFRPESKALKVCIGGGEKLICLAGLCNTPRVRQAFVRLGASVAITLLCCGCVSRKPLRAVSPEQRAGAELAYVGSANHFRHSSVNTRNTRHAGLEGGLIGGVVTIIAGAVESGSGNWMVPIREQTGEFEPEMLLEKVSARLQEITQSAATTNATAAPRLELWFVGLGLPELERGWFGAYGSARARLVDATGKEIWSTQATSTATKLRKRAEFEADPTLYKNDFDEVAADIARQLVLGPVRSSQRI